MICTDWLGKSPKLINARTTYLCNALWTQGRLSLMSNSYLVKHFHNNGMMLNVASTWLALEAADGWTIQPWAMYYCISRWGKWNSAGGIVPDPVRIKSCFGLIALKMTIVQYKYIYFLSGYYWQLVYQLLLTSAMIIVAVFHDKCVCVFGVVRNHAISMI